MSNPHRYSDEANSGTFGNYGGTDETDHVPFASGTETIEPQSNEGNRTANTVASAGIDEKNRGSNKGSLFKTCFGFTSSTTPSIRPISTIPPIKGLIQTKTPYNDQIMRRDDEPTERFDDNAMVTDGDLTITTPVLADGNCLTTEIESSVLLNLGEVKDGQGIIPLKFVRTERANDPNSGRCKLQIFIPVRKNSDTHYLRVQTQSEPFIAWKCSLKNQKGKRSSTVQMETSSVLKHAGNVPTANSYVHDPYMVNILLIGRSQVGKSVLIEALKDPNFSATRTGISQTREPSCKQLIMSSEDRQSYTLNIIDTPGLHEVRQDSNETRTDEQLLALLRNVFITGQVRALNIICFISVIGKTYQNDIDTFKSLIDFFGDRFKSISALILTHCDKISTERLHSLTEELKHHPACAGIVDYCQLGIYHHGTLDIDDLDTYKGEMRELIRQSTIERLEPMRAELTKFLLSRADDYVEIRDKDFDRLRELVDHKGKASDNLKKTNNLTNSYWLNNHVLICSIL